MRAKSLVLLQPIFHCSRYLVLYAWLIQALWCGRDIPGNLRQLNALRAETKHGTLSLSLHYPILPLLLRQENQDFLGA